MNERPLKPLRRGEARIGAANLNEAFRRIEARGRDEAAGSISQSAGGGAGNLISAPPEEVLLIRILDGTNPYSWEPVVLLENTGDPDVDYGVPSIYGGSANGSDGFAAYERNNNTTVPAGTIVEATVNGFLNCLEFSHQGGDGCGIPGVDFNTLQVVTDPDYVLAIKNGCIVLVAVGTC